MKVAPVELVEEKPPRFRAGCCDRKRRTPTRYRCHCEFSFFPSLRPPFIIMLGQSACPSWRSGLQLDPSSPRAASQPARLGAAARRSLSCMYRSRGYHPTACTIAESSFTPSSSLLFLSKPPRQGMIATDGQGRTWACGGTRSQPATASMEGQSRHVACALKDLEGWGLTTQSILEESQPRGRWR